MQHRGAFCGAPAGRPSRGAARLAAVEVADDHRQLAEALVGQPRGERAQRGAGRLDERGAQGEVLDGVPGQHHLGERHQVGALLGGVPGPVDDRVGVAGEVADGRVDLIQSEAKLRHAPSVIVFLTRCPGVSPPTSAVRRPAARALRLRGPGHGGYFW